MGRLRPAGWLGGLCLRSAPCSLAGNRSRTMPARASEKCRPLTVPNWQQGDKDWTAFYHVMVIALEPAECYQSATMRTLVEWFIRGGQTISGAIDVVLGSNEKITTTGEALPSDAESYYQPPERPYSRDENAYHFWSFHPGGAYFVFVDGHVAFVPYTVDKQVLPSLATRNGSEVVNAQGS